MKADLNYTLDFWQLFANRESYQTRMIEYNIGNLQVNVLNFHKQESNIIAYFLDIMVKTVSLNINMHVAQDLNLKC